MDITVNNQTKNIESNSLSSLIFDTLGDKTMGIAVAINQTIIPKNKWQTTLLQEKDDVLIIKATQGG